MPLGGHEQSACVLLRAIAGNPSVAMRGCVRRLSQVWGNILFFITPQGTRYSVP